MSQLNIKNLEKSFGDNQILKNINFTINYGEKLAIVGGNGCGKTTLLNIIAGFDEADSGNISMEKGIHIEILNQDSSGNFNPETDFSIIDQKYLSLLNIDTNTAFSPSLSGGEVTKFALCKLLSLNPNLLLLDEPTNNLDYEGINTLIQLLLTYEGSLIVISHDRYFLDCLIERIIEIENGISKEYLGNYSEYRETKQRLYNEALTRYQEDKKQQKQIESSIKQIKQWSDKAHINSTKKDSSGNKIGVKEYKRVKAKKKDQKIKNDIKRLEKMKTEGEAKPIEEKTVSFEIKNSSLHGKRILQADEISKSYGNKTIFDKSSFSIMRGEKVAVFGDNGCGKTTLINILEGTEELTSGELWLTSGCKPYILHQNFESLPQDITVFDYFINLLGRLSGEQRKTLNNLGLSARHINQKIGSLSFGEQMKLKLAEPILMERELIVLDEPTNHLDIHARQTLENTLKTYNGTLLIVSHDVEILRNLCDKVLLFKSGKIIRLEDSFDEFFQTSL